MRYIVVLTIAISSMFMGSCADRLGNNASAAENRPVNNATPPAVDADKPVAENECKVCNFDMASYKGDLNKEEINGLLLALNDEYLATATYQQVNKDLGDPRPFSNIVRAEIRHAEMLKEIFTKYGVPIPDNPWQGNVPRFASVADACKAGIDGEILNRDLYTRLFRSTERKDIIETYRYLQRASEENHLPAFERCGGGKGQGTGPGRGNGMGRGQRGI
ncbi:MAG TPA: hypothetical protein PLN05_08110 [Pyrinomonadaceae bacterium]|nr:hypothetical protein [Pyrinomonadaceae bacterium]HRK50375.1 hypothetical protein [Pyrinomonadaceae bacterium]